MTKTTVAVALATLALTSALGLSGCGAIENAVDDAVDNAVENAVEGVVENQAGEGVDINVGDDAALPADFPADVPTPEGGSIVASLGTSDGWNITYEFADMAPVEALTSQLKDAGWEELSSGDIGGVKTYAYQGPKYSASIVAGEQDGKVTCTYTVATNA